MYVTKLLGFVLTTLMKNKTFRSKLSKNPINDKNQPKRKF